MTPVGRLRIGEVHTLLRQEFPSIELSKIRYYEDKGLVYPSRSRKGYRLYSERDIECLREAFRLAQQEFVPLRVIRQRLIEQGLLPDEAVEPATKRAAKEAATTPVSLVAPTEEASTPTSPASPEEEPRRVATVRLIGTQSKPTLPLPGSAGAPSRMTPSTAPATPPSSDKQVAPAVAPAPSPVAPPPPAVVLTAVPDDDEDATLPEGLMTRKDFRDATGLTPGAMNDLVAYGFVRLVADNGVDYFSVDDIELAKDFGHLMRMGVEARHLQVLRRTVEREVELLAQLTEPIVRARRGRTPDDIQNDVSHVGDELQGFRSSLYNAALSDHLRDIGGPRP